MALQPELECSRAAIEFHGISYHLSDGREILKNLNFAVAPGEVLVLLGRSGSGKTTALKLVNRLLESSSGQLMVEGRANSKWNLIELRRHIGYAIQEVGLFPHYTVERNIALIPTLENWPTDKIQARVRELMLLVGLGPEILSRFPHQLSGGQRQRVGVARALAADPPILLMDEPFGALDPLTRSDLQGELRTLQQKLRKAVVFVTHDVHEALLLATRIALLESGELVWLGSAQEFRRSPAPIVTKYLQAFGTSID
jgi:osmoprotectant transport system ATP-binding protein